MNFFSALSLIQNVWMIWVKISVTLNLCKIEKILEELRENNGDQCVQIQQEKNIINLTHWRSIRDIILLLFSTFSFTAETF